MSSDFMARSIKRRKQKLDAEWQQLQNDADHWNSLHPDEEPIMMSETSREEIAKLCESLRRFKNHHGKELREQAADALLSQQRSLDRVAALCDADPEYLKAVGELPAFIRAVRAALEGREFRENA